MKSLLPARGHRREDYLKIIYMLSLEKKSIRVKDIALELEVKPASVVEYLEKLAGEQLIVYKKGEGVIELTEKGRKEARRIAEKYEAIYRFLVEALGIPSSEARREACYAEHGLSQETIRKIKQLLEAINSCREKCPELRLG